MIGVIFNRWDVTVSGLVIPLDYSPGTIYQSAAGAYWPSVAEWGVAIGVVGYALVLLTLGIWLLPLFNHRPQSK